MSEPRIIESLTPQPARQPLADRAGLRAHAPAKINLNLLVGPRRADGYHPLDSLVAWSFMLPVRTKAWDPDATTDTFGYSFRTSGFLYGDEIQPGTGRICETSVEVPDVWRRPGQYAIGVRVIERGYNDRVTRQAEFLMPFRIE